MSQARGNAIGNVSSKPQRHGPALTRETRLFGLTQPAYVCGCSIRDQSWLILIAWAVPAAVTRAVALACPADAVSPLRPWTILP